MNAEPGSYKIEALPVTLWTAQNFSEDWFSDTAREARIPHDHDARRREIIFAACFLETYIFEWTRRKVQIDELNDYFPMSPRYKNDPGYRRTLNDKWKEVPHELYKARKISTDPKLDLSSLGSLLKYRHALVHAAASRPATDSQRKRTKPFPTKGVLKKLQAGWALKIAVNLVESLHQAIGDPLPAYILRVTGKKL